MKRSIRGNGTERRIKQYFLGGIAILGAILCTQDYACAQFSTYPNTPFERDENTFTTLIVSLDTDMPIGINVTYPCRLRLVCRNGDAYDVDTQCQVKTRQDVHSPEVVHADLSVRDYYAYCHEQQGYPELYWPGGISRADFTPTAETARACSLMYDLPTIISNLASPSFRVREFGTTLLRNACTSDVACVNWLHQELGIESALTEDPEVRSRLDGARATCNRTRWISFLTEAPGSHQPKTEVVVP